jgi:hypothetical protein
MPLPIRMKIQQEPRKAEISSKLYHGAFDQSNQLQNQLQKQPASLPTPLGVARSTRPIYTWEAATAILR